MPYNVLSRPNTLIHGISGGGGGGVGAKAKVSVIASIRLPREIYTHREVTIFEMRDVEHGSSSECNGNIW